MLVSLSFRLCMSSATARVMAVSIFASTRKDFLEGCERHPTDRLRSLKWVVVPAALYSCDKVLYIFLVTRSVSDWREAKNANHYSLNPAIVLAELPPQL